MGAGLLLDEFFKIQDISAKPMDMEMLPEWATLACTVALLAVLAYALLFSRSHASHDEHEGHDHDADDACCEQTECSHSDH